MQHFREMESADLEQRSLSSVWLFLVGHDEWHQIIVSQDGVILGELAQWFIMQGPIAIHGWQLHELAFYWFGDAYEEMELQMETYVAAGSWLRIRFQPIQEAVPQGEGNVH